MAATRVRATINLPGLPYGSVAMADPDESAYLAMCFEQGFLVPDDEEAPDDPRDTAPA